MSSKSKDDDRQILLRSRRDFIRQVACAGVGSLAVTSSLRDMRLINSVLAQAGGLTDYKALVCLFLAGGNDCNNLLVPRGAEYSSYQAARQNLAIPELSLNPISPINNDGHSYGFHPNCSELANLFGEGKLAVLFNVGPLLYPTTRDQYQKKLVAMPPQLFSHSDQVTHWQTSIPDQPAKSGWGGRIADILHSQQPGADISLTTSLAGANTFEVGNSVAQYHVSTAGAVTLLRNSTTPLDTWRVNAMQNIINQSKGITHPNQQDRAYAEVMDRAIATGQVLNSAIAPTVDTGTTPPWSWATPFPNTTLGNQLKMVTRVIAARNALGMKRQIFFCSVGGYDTHTAQVGDNANPGNPLFGAHASLMNELSEGIYAFQRGIEQVASSAVLGADPSLVQGVTAFTASDFGRTFPTNGQGSDHGWGGHHLIIGGAVQGRRTFGTFPVLQINGPNDTSTGRWIPTTSVDEYSATLAKWFGVAASDMNTVFPNLGRFAVPDLGFMA